MKERPDGAKNLRRCFSPHRPIIERPPCCCAPPAHFTPRASGLNLRDRGTYTSPVRGSVPGPVTPVTARLPHLGGRLTSTGTRPARPWFRDQTKSPVKGANGRFRTTNHPANKITKTSGVQRHCNQLSTGRPRSRPIVQATTLQPNSSTTTRLNAL